MGIFDRLKAASRPALLAEPDDPVAPEHSEVLADALEKWATDKVCINTFLPHLDSLIASADAEESENLASHVGMAFARGKRESLKALRKEFDFWNDKRA